MGLTLGGAEIEKSSMRKGSPTDGTVRFGYALLLSRLQSSNVVYLGMPLKIIWTLPLVQNVHLFTDVNKQEHRRAILNISALVTGLFPRPIQSDGYDLGSHIQSGSPVRSGNVAAHMIIPGNNDQRNGVAPPAVILESSVSTTRNRAFLLMAHNYSWYTAMRGRTPDIIQRAGPQLAPTLQRCQGWARVAA